MTHSIPTFNARFSDLYKRPIDELKKQHSGVIINRAIFCWVHEGKYNEDEISDKIDAITCELDRAGKEEFIEIYKYYMTKGRLVRT